MKIKILSVALISLFIASPALALTERDIDLLYEAGFIPYEKVAPTKKAIRSGSYTTTKTQTPVETEVKFVYGKQNTANNSCVKLAFDLVNGMSSDAVTALQNFLKSKGYFSADATGYFGNITQTAVQDFQKAEGIALNGTPETTGFGKVGPATRSAIEKSTCTGASAEEVNFFGQSLDDIFNSSLPDFNYNVVLDNKVNLDYDIAFNDSVDFKIPEINFDEIDLDTDFDFEIPEINFDSLTYSSNLSGDNTKVALFAKAVNGQYFQGKNSAPVAVPSEKVELLWETENVKDCSLSGDFKEQRLSVPTDGSASITMTKPTGGTAPSGFPLFQFRINCSASSTRAYALPSSDSIKLLIYKNASSTNSQ